VLDDDDPLPILDSLQVIGQVIFQSIDTDSGDGVSSLTTEMMTVYAILLTRPKS